MADTARNEDPPAGSRLLRRVYLKEGWFLQQLGTNERMSVPSVPTDVYRVLRAHYKIADPVQDVNELSVRWVADKAWKYTVRLKIDADALARGALVDLVFCGLDTFATVRLDGEVILETDNMFLSHRCSITDLLNKYGSQNHEMEIVFLSARLRGKELIDAYKHEHRFIARQTEDSRIAVRKAQYHWGWDWGPILTGTSGPWRPVYLEYYHARVDDLWAESNIHDDGKCTGRLYCKTASTSELDQLRLSISYEGNELFSQVFDMGNGGSVSCSFDIANPKLW
jgi:beta-mannosidase